MFSKLIGVLGDLGTSIECLCHNISDLREDITAHRAELRANTEVLVLLRNREEQIYGQLDRLETWFAMKSDYPRTQEEVPGYTQIHARILEDARR